MCKSEVSEVTLQHLQKFFSIKQPTVKVAMYILIYFRKFSILKSHSFFAIVTMASIKGAEEKIKAWKSVTENPLVPERKNISKIILPRHDLNFNQLVCLRAALMVGE